MTLNKNKLTMGCACGRPHQIGDCPDKWKNKKTGRISNSPYQQWSKCTECYYYHPIINHFQYLPEYERVNKKCMPTSTILIDGKQVPAIKTKNGLVPAINIYGKWVVNKFAVKTPHGWIIKKKSFGYQQ